MKSIPLRALAAALWKAARELEIQYFVGRARVFGFF
jgi:hypothetical protein